MPEITPTLHYVTSPIFEGPIELLLRLINERKIPINEISLAQVTDRYIQTVQSMQNRSHDEISQFLVISATLLLIKSKSLLPYLSLTTEEEKVTHELEERLRMYQLIAEQFSFVYRASRERSCYERTASPFFSALFVPDHDVTAVQLAQVAHQLLIQVPRESTIPQTVVTTVLRIEDMIEDLTQRIQSTLQLSFSELVRRGAVFHTPEEYKEHKKKTVITFLALLEMVRHGILDVIQDQQFHDMAIMQRGKENQETTDELPANSADSVTAI